MAPRRRRRRSRRGDLSPRDLAIGGGIAVVALVLLVVGARFTIFSPGPPDRDPETGCPEAGPAALTAILIDVTDQVGAISRADVLAHLDEYVADSREDEMVLAYEAKPVGNEIGSPLLSVCHPGDPDEASEWTENPRLIRRRLEERFERPLEELFAELLGREPASTSPLMESVQSVAVSVLGRHEYAGLPKRLILVSDLMQNTRNLSFFRQAVDYEVFAATAGADALGTDLRGTAVEVLFVQRTAHRRLDGTRGLIDFWQRWIEEQGGTLNRVARIDGVN